MLRLESKIYVVVAVLLANDIPVIFLLTAIKPHQLISTNGQNKKYESTKASTTMLTAMHAGLFSIC